MTTAALSGNDVLSINTRQLVDFAVGKVTELTFDADIANVKTGKNGNSIYGLNYSGQVATLKLIMVRGSSDDGFLSSLLAQQTLNFAGTVLLIGQFIKNIGDGQGNITSDTYNLSGGVFTKNVHANTDTEGNAEQSVSEYMIKWALAQRTLT